MVRADRAAACHPWGERTKRNDVDATLHLFEFSFTELNGRFLDGLGQRFGRRPTS
jgi:hypothetical protein